MGRRRLGHAGTHLPETGVQHRDKFVARYDEAEHLTQEIFVRLFPALGTYDRRASFDAWLTRVSPNPVYRPLSKAPPPRR
jgi:DNA-directed RNA polymerase specialized sigma24 family protein